MTPRRRARIIPVSSLPPAETSGKEPPLPRGGAVVGRKSSLRAGIAQRRVGPDLPSPPEPDIPEDVEAILYGPPPEPGNE